MPARITAAAPRHLYRAAQLRELDRRAIEQANIPGIQLMQRAGRALFAALLERWPQTRRLLIFCGGGNNGGDGYIVAALALARRLQVELIETPGTRRGDALQARTVALEQGAHPIAAADWLAQNPEPEAPPKTAATPPTVAIDALLGTGFSGEVRPQMAALIERINALDCPRVAADIPSGLDCDTGHAAGPAIQADLTVSFIAAKLGMVTGRAANHCGELQLASLDVPAAIFQQMEPAAELLDLPTEQCNLPPRPPCNHKGDHGRLLIIGGDHGYGGAPLLAALAAAHAGAGLIAVLTRSTHIPAALAHCPQLMVAAAEQESPGKDWLNNASALVLGPGLGTAAWGQKLLLQTLAAQANSNTSLVIDADALNLLATPAFAAHLPLKNAVFTPHPGEAARLLDSSVAAVNRDRPAAITALRTKLGGTVLLKGSGTLIDTADGLYVCPYGNPALGTGGTGDLLAGPSGRMRPCRRRRSFSGIAGPSRHPRHRPAPPDPHPPQPAAARLKTR